jgi:hypothetical protein
MGCWHPYHCGSQWGPGTYVEWPEVRVQPRRRRAPRDTRSELLDLVRGLQEQVAEMRRELTELRDGEPEE